MRSEAVNRMQQPQPSKARIHLNRDALDDSMHLLWRIPCTDALVKWHQFLKCSSLNLRIQYFLRLVLFDFMKFEHKKSANLRENVEGRCGGAGEW